MDDGAYFLPGHESVAGISVHFYGFAALEYVVLGCAIAAIAPGGEGAVVGVVVGIVGQHVEPGGVVVAVGIAVTWRLVEAVVAVAIFPEVFAPGGFVGGAGGLDEAGRAFYFEVVVLVEELCGAAVGLEELCLEGVAAGQKQEEGNGQECVFHEVWIVVCLFIPRDGWMLRQGRDFFFGGGEVRAHCPSTSPT